MPRHIVVDGYNFLFAIGKTPHEADRNYLLRLLAEYKDRKAVDITVVFDRKTGDAAEGRQTLSHQGVRVIFSAPGQEADEIICQMAEAAKIPRDFLVVSSDKAGVSKYCSKLGAAVMESKEFSSFLSKHRPGAKSPAGVRKEEEEKPQASRADVEYYLEKFSDKNKKS